MIDIHLGIKDFEQFIEDVSIYGDMRNRGETLKKFRDKIIYHYRNQAEFVENVLPQKIKLMEVSERIASRTTPNQSNDIIKSYKDCVLDIYKELCVALVEDANE